MRGEETAIIARRRRVHSGAVQRNFVSSCASSSASSLASAAALTLRATRQLLSLSPFTRPPPHRVQPSAMVRARRATATHPRPRARIVARHGDVRARRSCLAPAANMGNTVCVTGGSTAGWALIRNTANGSSLAIAVDVIVEDAARSLCASAAASPPHRHRLPHGLAR